jgi:hypothetical protein
VCGEHALLTLQSMQGAALDEAGRDGVQLPPALEAAVGLYDSFKRIAHLSSLLLSGSPWQGGLGWPHLLALPPD